MNVLKSGSEWTCPYCQQERTLTYERLETGRTDMKRENSIGLRRFTVQFVVCPNPKCRKFALTGSLEVLRFVDGSWEGQDILQTWRLIPSSDAKIFPEYVPLFVRNDYEEACAIKTLSPKASATLARRCLQGMIRDFWKISKPRLIDEIEALKDKVDPLIWTAIDAVRRVGNIGAHMEKDINIIIDVDSNEATQLVGLIELLIKDWYINRYDREQRLKEIAALANAKKTAKVP